MYRGKEINDQIKFLLSFLPQEIHVLKCKYTHGILLVYSDIIGCFAFAIGVGEARIKGGLTWEKMMLKGKWEFHGTSKL